MIKKAIKKIFHQAGYSLIKNHFASESEIIERGKKLIEKISPRYEVLNGPFKGLKYPSLNITEAALVPKIIGSYESQLHPSIEKIIQTNYSDVIDVGSAEGYYAVGFAFRMPKTTIHCFDINESDLQFCRKMAKHNNLSNLTFNNFCSPETLINFQFKGKGLIFCDCEGYELELFNAEVIKSLQNTDLIIELHDVFNPVISAEILVRFQVTHNLQVINNLNVKRLNWAGLENLSNEDKEFAVLEHRGGLDQNIFMQWAILTAK